VDDARAQPSPAGEQELERSDHTFVYDAFGNLAAEYGGPVGPTGTQYLTSDHLGSTRLVTDSSGAAGGVAAWY
jgi:hypothetical protein